MRKGWLAVAAVLVLGGGFLGAQAYSSHVFERELARTLKRIDDDGQWHIERSVGARGWFHSRGRIELSPSDAAGWRVSLPYRARHGILHTRLSGTLQVSVMPRVDSSGVDSFGVESSDSSVGETAPRTLFGDVLSTAPPRWTATLDNLERRGKVRVDIAAFELDTVAGQLAFTGAELDIAGRANDVRITGQVAPLRLSRGDRQLVAGPLYINNRYQLGDGGGAFYQRNELILDNLEYHDPRRATLVLHTLRYSDEARLDEALRLSMNLSLEQARIADQALLAGNVELAVERVDGDAVRELVGELRAVVKDAGSDIANLDAGQRRALLNRLEPALLASLGDSPRLLLKAMNLSSPMFGVDTHGHGELVFDGSDSQQLVLNDLTQAATLGSWRKRLDGRFVAYEVPPLLFMQLGLPLDTRQLELTIDAGVVRLNDRPLPELGR